ncbi:hypothetical protein ACJJTC_019724 [Scirpophaga incertulas]
MKVKKQQRRKKYLHHLNRKRMNKNQSSTGTVLCKVMKDKWDYKKSTKRNLKEMGLANDPNKVIKIPNFKQQQLKRAKSMTDSADCDTEDDQEIQPPKIEVLQKLEQEAKAPRKRKFMLPKGQVEFITYLLDKYGHNYKDMAKDKKNYYQETWKQLRAKIRTFMGIPKQYGEYLRSRGLIDKEEDEEELQKQAKALVMDDSD